MHPYATDCPSRKLVPLILALLSIGCTWGLHHIFKRWQITLPWWVDAPSLTGFYGIGHHVFDTYVWRWPVWKRLGVVRLCDINGDWTGIVRSSHDGFGEPRKVQLKALQTWTCISIVLRAEESRSHSLTASLLVMHDHTEPVIVYTYSNEPLSKAAGTMHTHRGNCEISIIDDRMEGYYFSGRDRSNHGDIELKRHGTKKKLKNAKTHQ